MIVIRGMINLFPLWVVFFFYVVLFLRKGLTLKPRLNSRQTCLSLTSDLVYTCNGILCVEKAVRAHVPLVSQADRTALSPKARLLSLRFSPARVPGGLISFWPAWHTMAKELCHLLFELSRVSVLSPRL